MLTGGAEVKANSLILPAGSPVLAAMFQHDTKEKQTRVVELKDVEHKVFLRLLQFLYTGKTENLDGKTAEDLLAAADKYAVEALKEECAAQLAKGLKVDNVCHVLILAHFQSCPELLQSALEFMGKNGKAVCSHPDWLDLLKKYPELAFQVTQAMWASRKCCSAAADAALMLLLNGDCN